MDSLRCMLKARLPPPPMDRAELLAFINRLNETYGLGNVSYWGKHFQDEAWILRAAGGNHSAAKPSITSLSISDPEHPRSNPGFSQYYQILSLDDLDRTEAIIKAIGAAQIQRRDWLHLNKGIVLDAGDPLLLNLGFGIASTELVIHWLSAELDHVENAWPAVGSMVFWPKDQLLAHIDLVLNSCLKILMNAELSKPIALFEPFNQLDLLDIGAVDNAILFVLPNAKAIPTVQEFAERYQVPSWIIETFQAQAPELLQQALIGASRHTATVTVSRIPLEGPIDDPDLEFGKLIAQLRERHSEIGPLRRPWLVRKQ